jgi:hypothetical protein
VSFKKQRLSDGGGGIEKRCRRRSPSNGRKRAKFRKHYSIYIFFRRNRVFYRHISESFLDFSVFFAGTAPQPCNSIQVTLNPLRA